MERVLPVAEDSLQRFFGPDGWLVYKVVVHTLHQPVVVHTHASHHHPLWSKNKILILVSRAKI